MGRRYAHVLDVVKNIDSGWKKWLCVGKGRARLFEYSDRFLFSFLIFLVIDFLQDSTNNLSLFLFSLK